MADENAIKTLGFRRLKIKLYVIIETDFSGKILVKLAV